MPILFYSPGACSLTVHIALEEIGIPYELRRVDLIAGQQFEADFQRLNPKGKIPVLVLDTPASTPEVLTEAPAILYYLARQYPEAALLPSETLPFVRAAEWLNYLSGSVHSSVFGAIFRPQRFTGGGETAEKAVAAQAKNSVVEHFKLIEERLAAAAGHGGWALPSGFSLVDAYLAVIYRWGWRVGFDMTAYPNWTTHTAQLRQRPAVQRALTQEGVDFFPAATPA